MNARNHPIISVVTMLFASTHLAPIYVSAKINIQAMDLHAKVGMIFLQYKLI